MGLKRLGCRVSGLGFRALAAFKCLGFRVWAYGRFGLGVWGYSTVVTGDVVHGSLLCFAVFPKWHRHPVSSLAAKQLYTAQCPRSPVMSPKPETLNPVKPEPPKPL